MTERMTPKKAMAALSASDDGLYGVEHRFIDFSEDFGAWVVFYGPQGGEAAK